MSDEAQEEIRQDLDEVAAYSVGVLLATTALARALIKSGAVEKSAIQKMVQDAGNLNEEAPPLMAKALEQFLALLDSDDDAHGVPEPLGFSLLTDFLDRLGKGSSRSIGPH